MGDDHADAGATTNAHDLAEAAKLQARLAEHNNKASASVASSANEAPPDAIPAVSLAEGAYKYVLVTAVAPSNNRRTFVYSKRNASYHRNVAEHLVPISWRMQDTATFGSRGAGGYCGTTSPRRCISLGTATDSDGPITRGRRASWSRASTTAATR